MRIYVGTYTDAQSGGIFLYDFDENTGRMASLGVAGHAVHPSFLAFHPNRRFLYAVNETGDVKKGLSGSLSAFAIDPASGKLSMLNKQPSGGAGPCFVFVDRAGRHALTANYSSGSIAVLPIGDDGQLGPATATIQHHGHGPDPDRQKGPHAHSINLDPSGRFALAADLGLDKLFVYRFDTAHGTLQPNDPPAADVPPGSGPRHLAFHPDGKFAYLINEMGCTISVLAYDAARGAFSPLQTISTLPPNFRGQNTTAEVQVHPSGQFVYGSNRGHDSIALFRVDPATGKLTAIGHEPTQGRTPRNFAIDPTGRFLVAANQDSNNLVVFRLDPTSGQLQSLTTTEAPKPVCVKFLPR